MALCKAGASVRETCINADKRIEEETGKAFKKDKNLLKGIAFPCCVSVNNTICHFSPLNSEPDVVMQDGDVVKIDMGAHIDGFIAVVAHTVIVSDGKSKITGRKADAVLAAHLAAEAALRPTLSKLKPFNGRPAEVKAKATSRIDVLITLQ